MNAATRATALTATALVLVLHCAVAAGQSTVPLQPAVDEFHFVVLGDSQFDDPPAFNRMIDEVRELRPALVIQVGDLINGYTDDAALVRQEWARFRDQIKPLGDIPYFAVAGNHDLYGAGKEPTTAMEGLFRSQWGELRYTFEYRNARFVVLNSDAAGAPNQIAADQLTWLEGVLEDSTATHTFVFMHRPPALLANQDELHEVLVEHEVDWVFYGHYHHHHQLVRDGVTYVMTNASGDTPINFRATGSEDHFLLVNVRDNQAGYAMIAADSITGAGTVTAEDNATVFRLKRALGELNPIANSALEAMEDGSFRLDLKLSNPTDRTVDAYVEWNSPDGRWKFSPSAGARVTLPVGARNKAVPVILSRPDGSRPEGWPHARVQIPILTSSGRWVVVDQLIEVAAPE